MTHRRLNNLLIAVIFSAFFLIGVLFLTLIAQAKTVKFNYAAYLMLNNNRSSGYDLGVGPYVESWGRYEFLELRLSGMLNYEKKRKSDYGYTYGYGIEGRGYVYGPWYVLGAYKTGGYKSTFSNGTIWAKHGHHLVAGAGYYNGDTDVTFSYYFQENVTPNRVQYTSLTLRQRIWKWFHTRFVVGYTTFDQRNKDGNLERWTGFSVLFGLGVKF